jgi:CopA family copper-resistance protein
MMKRFLFLGFLFAVSAQAEVKKYELFVEKKSVNLSGKKEVDFALMVNGGIPAPTLTFQEGDTAEIVVHNRLEEEVSIHWHGILLPPDQDGVAYVNTPPIYAGKSHTFRFPIRQHGTYWYHSHTSVQEQKGVYGAFIIHPKKRFPVDHDLVAVISDWSDEDANQILKNLKKDGDYYLYKKNSIRSYFGALAAGGLGEMLKNEWQRMGGMDLSDVGYDAFLINGKTDSQLAMAHPGEKVRLRIINSGASSYFTVSLGGQPFQVISADGVDIEPVEAREILMGMAETYDILFEVPEHKNYELRATAQDVSGFASAWIGMGEKVFAPTKKPIDLYGPMNHGAHAGHTAHQSRGAADLEHSSHQAEGAKEDHNDHANHSAHANHKNPVGSKDQAKKKSIKRVEGALTVDDLRAKKITAFSDKKILDVRLVLGGDMERYVWHINGKAIHEDRNLLIEEGQVVRYTFVNETMMHHPMHLHGHFFRVLNPQGDYSPLKHTVDVPPHGSRTIEFLANEPGEWMLHCHNLYHMKTGMARVVKYSSFIPKSEVAKHQAHDPHLHDHLYWDGQVQAATNQGEVFFRLSKTWDSLELKVETKEENKSWEVGGDLFYRRWMGKYWNLIFGGSSFEDQQRGVAGVGVILPLLIEADLLVDHRGKFRADLDKKFQWTSKILSEAEVSWRQHEGVEWMVNLLYQPNWHWGAGLYLNDEKLGVGAKIRF